MERDAAAEEPAAVSALRCPRCASPLSRVLRKEIHTIKTCVGEFGAEKVRGEKSRVSEKRECEHCGRVFTTNRDEEEAEPAKKPRLGVECPNCKSTDLAVLHTRRYAGQHLRERKCNGCGRKIFTREKIA